MAIALEQFVQQLEESGILAGDTIKDFIPPKAAPKDTQELARELVRQKKLTKFQAEEAYKGNASSLVLGNYVLMEKIGAGGMGQVFRAEHRRMKRIVAIKLLPPSMTKDKDSIARFEREVEAAAKISHPNIVAAYDADCANGVHFLVMELVEGSDLSALVKRQGPFSVAMALKCIIQAAKGLEAAHRKGIVHRDIKPANLLLDNEGTVKILDMGLARLSDVSGSTAQAELTSTGTIMGTVDYMAPEQALDTRTADARADIYALGCSLHFLLTGKTPYQGDTLMKKLLAHRDQPIPALSARRPEVTEHIEAVFTKMVAKRSEERYQTATQLLLDLERCSLEIGQTDAANQGLGPAGTILRPDVYSVTNSDDDFSQNRTVISNELPESSISIVEGIIEKEEAVEVRPSIVAKKVLTPPINRPPRMWLMIGGGFLGALVLVAGLLVKLKTKDGTLIVTVNEPDAEVQVLNEEGSVEITRKGETGPITISVDPGKHRLKVTKDGFTVFGQEFEIEEGGRQPITASLMPLEKRSGMAEPTLASSDSRLAVNAPWFADWAKEVAAMPAERQVDAVRKKLVELNPKFDGKATFIIHNNIVQMFQLYTDHVVDISPVKALVHLDELQCPGSSFDSKGILSDLTPLRGLRLKSLTCRETAIADLSPLEGMPLEHLVCYMTQVTDLSPLKGMHMTLVNFSYTQVSDLSPLKGMPLKFLSLYGTPVHDLSPIEGMRLETLNSSDTRISDYSVIKSMPLQDLWLNFKPERDSEILRTLKSLKKVNDKSVEEFWAAVDDPRKGRKPLAFTSAGFDQWVKGVADLPAEEHLEAVSQKMVELNPKFDGKFTGFHFDGIHDPEIEAGAVLGLGFCVDHVVDISPVRAFRGLVALKCFGSQRGLGQLSDLTPLEGMPLKGFICSRTEVLDLTPISKMQLKTLEFSDTPVSDLSPLRGMSLEWIDCMRTGVSDISVLEGMPLFWVGLSGNHVSDISVLHGMSITDLQCVTGRITDLSPITGMPLTTLSCDFLPERDAKILRSIETLKTINHTPAAEFWKQIDEVKSQSPEVK